MRTDFAAHWDELAEDVLSGMKEWRLQHPKATLRQIKAALDEHLGKLRRWRVRRRISRRRTLPNGRCVAPVGARWWNGR